MISLLITLVLYTIGTWGSFRSKVYRHRYWVFIWIGFIFDVIASAMMAVQAGGIQNDLHTMLAFIAMAGMLLAASLGSWSAWFENEKIHTLISRWVPVPWLIWVILFVWGIIERASARFMQ